jgi:Type ISP C-terminal specificity domain/N-6 DNA Methylase
VLDVTEGSLKRFLDEVSSVRSTHAGTPETAYYPALSNLFNTIGNTLKPKVRAVITLKNMGAGLPDGGFFTPDQFDRNTDEVQSPLAPSRGVLEVKPPSDSVDDTATSLQIDKYWNRYKLVLVTNLRDWLLLGERNGKRVKLERYLLTDDEVRFWHIVAQPIQAEEKQGAVFADFLARVMLHAAPLSDPKDLAWFLASYARTARHRVAHVQAAGVQQLTALKVSLEGALGVGFKGEKGDHFFQSTLVQTLFYGVFAAWVLKHREGTGGPFDWKSAAWYLHVPMIDALFAQLAQPTRLQALDLEEVLDWAGDALNRVDQASFFSKFEAEHSVQYFYEPFLQAFDPELRKELGVWYTPIEIIRYMVARVDQVLKMELGLADGLADPNVVVLDPCCGTGAYLVEVLRHIAERLKSRGEDALAAHDLKLAATTRLFGFELLPAPFIIAHLQLGLLLHDCGAPLTRSAHAIDERAGVYLTNALTGWEPLQDPKSRVLPFPEFAQERDAADAVKQTRKILVILGNPPYNGYAGVAAGEERSLSEAYRQAKIGPQPQGQGLNELYVRFFRMAERQIAEKTGYGVICYVSNYSWLDGLSHTAMRERFIEAFDSIRIDNLQGDKYRTGKLTPTGEPDPSVFSTPQNREGIQVGTAITTMVRRDQPSHAAQVVHREWWGRTKLEELLAASKQIDAVDYLGLVPQIELGRAFGGKTTSSNYLSWMRLPEIFPISYPGVKTSRDGALVDVDRTALELRMRRYFDATVSDAVISVEIPELMANSARFDGVATRKKLISLGMDSGHFVRYCYRPFDVRWLYWHPETKLLDEKRPDYFPQVFGGNFALVSQQKPRRDWSAPQFIQSVGCLDLMDRGATCITLNLRDVNDDLLGQHGLVRANLSDPALAYLNTISANVEALFFHTLAVLHSSEYRSENSSALRQDWPRVPLPANLAVLLASADLGRRVAALLNTDAPVPGVTSGALRPEIQAIATITRVGGGALKPSEFAVTAGWGHFGKGGIAMPGRGKLVLRAAQAGEVPASIDASDSPQTWDVSLNDAAYWKNIPPVVWDYTIGGYQVIKKWLSYREQSLLGRPLSVEEVREITAMARRIAALVLLNGELDTNYKAVVANAYPAKM